MNTIKTLFFALIVAGVVGVATQEQAEAAIYDKFSNGVKMYCLKYKKDRFGRLMCANVRIYTSVGCNLGKYLARKKYGPVASNAIDCRVVR